jgi:hypothetical protein
MWPPIPGVSLFAFVTIAIAFHRTVDFIFRSIARSPGKSGSSPGKIVLTKGVFVLKSSLAPLDCTKEMSVSSKNPALLFPSSSRASSIASNHSWVSSGSISFLLFIKILRPFLSCFFPWLVLRKIYSRFITVCYNELKNFKKLVSNGFICFTQKQIKNLFY